MRGSMSLFFLLTCATVCYMSSYCTGQGTILCHEIEKQALLHLKKSVEEDPSSLLYSWNATDQFDCCMWEGVVCSNLTGRVHELHLRGRLGYNKTYSGKELNPSLLSLKHLRLLDLSHNYFGGTIPTFIGSFASLVYLDLSDSGFQGTIPYHIGNLSNLRTLSIREPLLEVDSLDWLSHLSCLEHLDMSKVDLAKATNWLQVINSLPSLIELTFRSCRLGMIAPLDHVNLSSLTVLDLSINSFRNATVPTWIFQLEELTFLNVRGCDFSGPIPNSSNITKLQHIDLSWNRFDTAIPNWVYLCNNLEFANMGQNFLHGTISESIANLTSLKFLDLSTNQLSGKISQKIAVIMCNLRNLDLSYNKLEGEIQDMLGSMPNCDIAAMKTLQLQHNQLSGHLPDIFGKFERLQTLDMSENSVSGSIPISLGKLSALRRLRLELNKLTGCLPESFGQLINLELVSLSNNKMEGIVKEIHFSNLTKLRIFEASGNHLTLKVGPTWIPPVELTILALGSWSLGTDQIPIWLETKKEHIEVLDLSGTGLISDRIPTWFWSIGMSLDLSHNQLYGNLTDLKNGFPMNTVLSSNRFSGPLPRVGTILLLDLSNNSFSGGITQALCGSWSLEVLNLEGNKLSGKIPDCLMKFEMLRYLNLGNNMISDIIPKSIGLLSLLTSLNLYNNSFYGQMPSSLQNCSQLLKIDLSYNEFVGELPEWLGTRLPNLRILILGSNKLSGKLLPQLCHLSSLQILDLSNNNLSGLLPHCFNNFTVMTTNGRLENQEKRVFEIFSWYPVLVDSAIVHAKGKELHYDSTLSLVTNIDLSKNNFSGEIPEELTRLVVLRSLNLSQNRLQGSIPETIGNMSQLESLDFSWNFLFGEIPDSISTLTSLNFLNLSFNNLTGRIPGSTQLQSLPDSSFIGNNLCGLPLTSRCNTDNANDTPNQENINHDDTSIFEVDWFYAFLASGYVTGFSVVCITLIFNKTFRDAYFSFFSDTWDRLYVWYMTR